VVLKILALFHTFLRLYGIRSLQLLHVNFDFLTVNIEVMDRVKSINFLNHNDIQWDIIVIGGGATGLGTALDASLRGYKTLLLEQADFTKGTSSRSTKLVHGGVRYLAQGNVGLVLEALHERGLMLKNAPHVTDNQTFIIPSFSWFDAIKYTLGLKIYDLMSGSLSLGKSGFISAKQIIRALPGINKTNLKNGIVYHDGQFDDARLGINLAQSAVDNGAHVINYMQVVNLWKDSAGKVNSVEAKDLETGKTYHLKTKVVVNATGVFVDKILGMDEEGKQPIVRASQGTHIVLDQSFLPSDYALMIPKTSDGRVLFAIPWHNKLVVGTTDTLVEHEHLEPRPQSQEVDFILETLNQYIYKKATRSDILSVFSGLRPLARPQNDGHNTKEISRSHKLFVSESGLVTITGGKWTTYRKMAEDTVDLAIKAGNLKPSDCFTETFHIHGYTNENLYDDHLHIYGSDAQNIRELAMHHPALAGLLHPDYPYLKAEVVWAVRNEMAIHVEDFLARRIRILLLDAKAAIKMASVVAKLMADELHKDQHWINQQVNEFETLAKGYLIGEE
jgi:glycerol-3-phosphate dehydrogenase